MKSSTIIILAAVAVSLLFNSPTLQDPTPTPAYITLPYITLPYSPNPTPQTSPILSPEPEIAQKEPPSSATTIISIETNRPQQLFIISCIGLAALITIYLYIRGKNRDRD